MFKRHRCQARVAGKALLACLVAMSLIGCDESGAPDPAEISAEIIPRLPSYVSGGDVRRAAEQLVPQVINDIVAVAPDGTPGAQMAEEYTDGPWEIDDPGPMWDRVTPDPGLGSPPPAPGGSN